MTPHAKLLSDICEWFKAHKVWYVRTNSHGYGRKGIPDVLACYMGRFVAVEAKVLPDKPSPWQMRELKDIQGAGGIALVVHRVEDLGRVFIPQT